MSMPLFNVIYRIRKLKTLGMVKILSEYCKYVIYIYIYIYIHIHIHIHIYIYIYIYIYTSVNPPLYSGGRQQQKKIMQKRVWERF